MGCSRLTPAAMQKAILQLQLLHVSTLNMKQLSDSQNLTLWLWFFVVYICHNSEQNGPMTCERSGNFEMWHDNFFSKNLVSSLGTKFIGQFLNVCEWVCECVWKCYFCVWSGSFTNFAKVHKPTRSKGSRNRPPDQNHLKTTLVLLPISDCLSQSWLFSRVGLLSRLLYICLKCNLKLIAEHFTAELAFR